MLEPEPEVETGGSAEELAAHQRQAALIPVFERLLASDRFRAARVCRAWRSAGAAPQSWASLDIRGSAKPAAWLARYAGHCVPPLRWTTLNAEFCKLADGDLQALPASMLSLNLNGSREIGDQGAQHISTACPELECIELYWNSRMTAVGIGHIGRRCHKLRHLNLSGCKGATGDSLKTLASEGSGRLNFLDLTRCPGLTDDSIVSYWCTTDPQGPFCIPTQA